MASSAYYKHLEEVIDYHFNESSLLEKALTAPGAEGNKEGTAEEKDKYEGHRLLAKSGRYLLPLLVVRRVFSEGNSGNGSTKDTLESAVAAKDYTERATALGIHRNIKLCPRQRGVAGPGTLRQAIYALIGAVWQDSGENFLSTEKVVERLFISSEIPLWTNPRGIAWNHSSCNNATLESHLRFGTDRNVPQHDADLFHETNTFHSPENVSLASQPQQRNLSSNRNNPLLTGVTEVLERTPYQIQMGQDNENRRVQKPSASETPPKKRKSSISNSELRQTVQLDKYLALEEKRCQSFGLSFLPMEIGLAINGLKIPLWECDLAVKTLFFVIGSPESIVALQEVIRSQRTSLADKQYSGGCDLSLADRVKAIEGTGSEIAYLVFRKRCHIHQLFIDCSRDQRRTSDGFVVDTVQSVSKQAGSRSGNPHNLENSKIAKEIMREVYPNLEPGTEPYRKKKRFVHRLRKLGERFDMLVRTFGYGILGLLSWPRDDLLDLPALSVTDELILSLSDQVFRSIVLCLKQVQNDYLCAISSAVSGIVMALFSGTLDPTKVSSLEMVDSAKFLECPMGSAMLLSLVSSSSLIE